MTGKLIGLDIQNDSLSALVAERTVKGLILRQGWRVQFADLVQPAVEGQRPSSPAPGMVELAIRKLQETIDLEGCSSAAVCLPSGKVAFRSLTLPFRSQGKIRQILDFELSGDLPLSDVAYTSDFILLPESHTASGAGLITASVPEPELDSVFQPLTAMGIRPGLITCRGYIAAAFWCSRDKGNESSVLIIDVIETGITLSLAVNGKVVLIRAGNKRLDNPDAIVTFVRQTLTGYARKQGREPELSQCVLLSFSDNNQALTSSLAEALHCPVTPMELPDREQEQYGLDRAAFTNLYASLDAMVMGRPVLNFCRNRFSSHSLIRQYVRPLATTAVFACVAMLVFMTGLYTDISRSRRQISRLDSAAVAEFQRLFPETRTLVDPLMQMQAAVKKARENFTANGGNVTAAGPAASHKTIDVLLAFSKTIPRDLDVEMTRLLYSPDRILLSGTTDTFNTVDRVKGLIEETPMFSQVTINSAATDKSGKRIRFQFVIDY